MARRGPRGLSGALDAFLDRVALFDYLALLIERRTRRRRELRAKRRNPGIHPSVELGDVRVDANVTIGEGTYMRSGELLTSAEATITIGRFCAIGRNVSMKSRTHDPEYATGDASGARHARRHAPIVVGDHVWIGDNVYVREGVHIGDHAVVGANAVVTKDVPVGAVVGGVPARIIRSTRPSD